MVVVKVPTHRQRLELLAEGQGVHLLATPRAYPIGVILGTQVVRHRHKTTVGEAVTGKGDLAAGIIKALRVAQAVGAPLLSTLLR
ncbi:hypothetical protein D3C71_1845590 [compost metagenome]